MRKAIMPKMASLRALSALLLCWCAMGEAAAQFARSTYLMEATPFRQQLNPALTPEQGYVNVPVLGGMNVSVNSNALGTKDVTEVVKNSSDADYFLSDDFMGRLKSSNNVQLNLSTDLLSLGWYKGRGFWTTNVALKVDAGASIPQAAFQRLRDARGMNPLGWTNYSMNLGGEKARINSYIEAAVGYAHPLFGDRLTLGGRVKVLFGVANIELDVRRLEVNTRLTGFGTQQDWTKLTTAELKALRGEAGITTDATLEASMRGFELSYDNKGRVDDVKRKGSLGVAGMGLGVDLGAAYQPISGLTLSASLLDLGFISWSKSASHRASSALTQKYAFDGSHLNEARDFQQLMASGELLNFDLLQIKQEEARSRTTSLYATLVLGGEYRLLDNHLSLGLLSTTRFTQPKALSEITLSSAYSVNRFLGFSLSYSVIQSGGLGLGAGLKLGPFTLATDYIYFNQNNRSLNALFGISIPLGARKG